MNRQLQSVNFKRKRGVHTNFPDIPWKGRGNLFWQSRDSMYETTHLSALLYQESWCLLLRAENTPSHLKQFDISSEKTRVWLLVSPLPLRPRISPSRALFFGWPLSPQKYIIQRSEHDLEEPYHHSFSLRMYICMYAYVLVQYIQYK